MGTTQSTIKEHGYTIQTTTDNGVVATSKEGDCCFIRNINISQLSDITSQELNSENETLKDMSHPHIVCYRNFFQDENSHYIVSDHCQGGNIAQKIKEKRTSGQMFEEDQILHWIVQICMALKYIHERGLLHKTLTPQRIFLTESGTICLGGFEDLVGRLATGSSDSENGPVCYLSPDILTDGINNNKSDIWSLGCVLYELCTLNVAFTAKTTIRLTPKILDGPYPSLPGRFTPELRQLLDDIFQKDPHSRPTASEILRRPFIISFLSRKSKETTDDLQANLVKLRTLADGLENIHHGTTIGSLTGGVIGAVGGVTSIVGLILAPFTLGASLVVTGVGIGVAVTGGATAGISNITNMVSQSTDRQAVRSIIKELGEKMNSVVTTLQEIGEGLEALRQNPNSPDFEGSGVNAEVLRRAGARVGRGVGGISELVRLVQVVRLGNVAAQTAKIVRVAEVATGLLSVLFVAVDVFFIAMDAKEIQHINEARAAETTRQQDGSRLALMETDSASELEPQSDPATKNIKSETMKFVVSIRQTVEKLQEIVDELSEFTSLIS